MKKNYYCMMCLVVLFMSCVFTSCTHTNEYVDLGLPSGTLWKSVNEEGFYTYESAIEQFGDSVLPTKEQIDELCSLCRWEEAKNAEKVVGPNGKYIILPIASGVSSSDSDNSSMYGGYWSSTNYIMSDEEYQVEVQSAIEDGGVVPSEDYIEKGEAWYMEVMGPGTVIHGVTWQELSVRLVKNK